MLFEHLGDVMSQTSSQLDIAICSSQVKKDHRSGSMVLGLDRQAA